jgi:lipoprotein-anchoring transpeptidase ErfK/SrfK
MSLGVRACVHIPGRCHDYATSGHLHSGCKSKLIARPPALDTDPDQTRSDTTMTRATPICLIAALLLVAQAIAPSPAAAQTYGEPPAPTTQDADPGVDHTALAAELPAEFRRTSVFYRTSHPPGTIIVKTADRFRYRIMGNNVALRYGIGVGRAGFQWGGVHVITRKAEWPDWRPPSEMIARQPYLPRFMAGGPGNPLGARALYIGTTDYRIHGTNAPETIGQAVSSGCFRLVNDDVIDLYSRVPVGTKVVVQHQ